jgi:hypothetical protein
VRSVDFATHAMLGAWRDQDRGSFSEEDNEAQKQQHEEGVGGSRASGEDAKKK